MHFKNNRRPKNVWKVIKRNFRAPFPNIAYVSFSPLHQLMPVCSWQVNPGLTQVHYSHLWFTTTEAIQFICDQKTIGPEGARRKLEDANITTVVDASSKSLISADNLINFSEILQTVPSEEAIRNLTKDMQNAIASDSGVLIFCDDGDISTVCMTYYIMRTFNWGLNQALHYVENYANIKRRSYYHSRNPESLRNLGLLRKLYHMEKEDLENMSLLDRYWRRNSGYREWSTRLDASGTFGKLDLTMF